MIKKRIIFMGTPEISAIYLESLIKDKHNIIGVYTQPPRKKGRGMKITESPVYRLANLNLLKIFTPKDFNLNLEKEIIKKLKPELIIVMGYGLKLPKYILDLPDFGCINIHVSLLPRWRGAAPIEHALLNGDEETGVTIFKIIEKMDAGPIITKESVKINNKINKGELTKKLNICGIKLLRNILPKIYNQNISYETQNKNKVTYAKKISSDMRKINFFDDIEYIQNKIRAFAPSPCAWFFYKNERIKIIKSDYIRGNWQPSIILNKDFHIGCKLGKICPQVIQREGKNPMDLKNFLRGFVFEIGSPVNE